MTHLASFLLPALATLLLVAAITYLADTAIMTRCAFVFLQSLRRDPAVQAGFMLDGPPNAAEELVALADWSDLRLLRLAFRHVWHWRWARFKRLPIVRSGAGQ